MLWSLVKQKKNLFIIRFRPKLSDLWLACGKHVHHLIALKVSLEAAVYDHILVLFVKLKR